MCVYKPLPKKDAKLFQEQFDALAKDLDGEACRRAHVIVEQETKIIVEQLYAAEAIATGASQAARK
eukprot:6213730-Pleurochrysis_carterae.AAC.3